MIRLRQRMATEVDANLASGVDTRPATVIGSQSVARATKAVASRQRRMVGRWFLGTAAKPVRQGPTRRTRKGKLARHGHDETALLAPPSGDVCDRWISLIRMRVRLGEPSFVLGHAPLVEPVLRTQPCPW